jgi:hypothetical protein
MSTAIAARLVSYCRSWHRFAQGFAVNENPTLYDCIGHVFFPLKRLGGRSNPFRITRVSVLIAPIASIPARCPAVLAGMKL